MPAWKGARLGATCCSLHLLGGSRQPPLLGVGKLRQAQDQQSRPAGSARCPGEGAELVAGRGGAHSPSQ